MRLLAAAIVLPLLLVEGHAKDITIHHVLTLTVFDKSHKKVFTIDRGNINADSNPYVTPKVGDLVNVSIKGEITHCVVTSTATTYVLDPGKDPKVAVSVDLTQTP